MRILWEKGKSSKNEESEVDRVNKNYGYTPENCTSACCFCNAAKSDLLLEDFIAWIKDVQKNYSNLPKKENEVIEMINNGYFIDQARKMQVNDYFEYFNQ